MEEGQARALTNLIKILEGKDKELQYRLIIFTLNSRRHNFQI